MIKAVIFDLDGTLVDSAPDIQASVNLMLNEEGLDPLDLPTVISFVGNGLPKLVERVMAARDIAETEYQRLSARTLEIYNASNSEQTVPYAGVVETLEMLQSQAVVLRICTNKPEQPARHVLNGLGLDRFFDVVVGGDTLSVRKPDPAPLFRAMSGFAKDEVIYVGDSEVDAETATKAGVRFALFTEGYRKSSIEEMTFQASFSDWSDFETALATLGISLHVGCSDEAVSEL